jgi:flagellar M-ring protein FliF
MPQKALFEEEQQPPTASVALQLQNAGGLDKDSVTGVANLVASAVEGLSTDQVTVVDQNGQVLNGDDKDQPKTGPGDELLAYQRGIEGGLEKELTSLVERVVGPGQAEVRVNAAIDDEKVQLHEVNYDPFSKAARSKRVRTKVSQDEAAGGAAGAEANVPGGEGEGDGNGATSSNLKEEVTNYEISKTVRDVLRPGGGLKRLTVAVLVGGQQAAPGGDGQQGFQSRSEEQLASIRELVANAAGIDPERGDQVTVKSLPMEGAGADTAAAQLGQSDNWDLYMTLARYGGYVLVTLLVLLFAVRPLMRYLSEGRHRLPVAQPAYPGLEGPAQGGGESAAPQRDQHLQEMEQRRQQIEERAAAEEERRDHVRSMVQQRQDNAASVIRQWLRE